MNFKKIFLSFLFLFFNFLEGALTLILSQKDGQSFINKKEKRSSSIEDHYKEKDESKKIFDKSSLSENDLFKKINKNSNKEFLITFSECDK